MLRYGTIGRTDCDPWKLGNTRRECLIMAKIPTKVCLEAPFQQRTWKWIPSRARVSLSCESRHMNSELPKELGFVRADNWRKGAAQRVELRSLCGHLPWVPGEWSRDTCSGWDAEGPAGIFCCRKCATWGTFCPMLKRWQYNQDGEIELSTSDVQLRPQRSLALEVRKQT